MLVFRRKLRLRPETVREEFAFCPLLAELLATRRAIGRTGKRFDQLAALSSLNNLTALRRLMLEFAPEKTLEVGLSFGGSALTFTSSHRDLHSAPARQHVAIDPFQRDVWDDSGLLAVEQAGLSDFLDFRPRFSRQELPRLIEEGHRFDLVYIDGSHLFEDVFVDAYYVLRLLNDRGLVAFDDSADPHVAKVLRFLRRTHSAELRQLDLSRFRPSELERFLWRIAQWRGKTQLTVLQRVAEIERAWDAPFRAF